MGLLSKAIRINTNKTHSKGGLLKRALALRSTQANSSEENISDAQTIEENQSYTEKKKPSLLHKILWMQNQGKIPQE
ncbi:MAG: hypothetical protein ACLFR1_11915 [Spirochaetia bacterium]